MATLRTAVLLCAGLGLAACTNPARLDDTGSDVDLGNTVEVVDTTAITQNTPAYFTTTIGDRVTFLVNDSTLTPEARQTLAGQATWLAQNASYAVRIEGHADEQGTREYNLALGARRASAVQQFLISQGVSPDRLRTVTFGKERPIEICSQESCYQKNRRAVSVLDAGTS